MRKTLLNIGNSYLFTGIVVAIDKDFGYEVLDDEWSADDGTQPHAVTGVENEDYVIASSAQTVAYNPWGKVSSISEGDDLRNYMNYYNEFTDYDCNGNVTRLLRGGLTNNLNGTFGLVDNLWMTYEGNRLVSVRDSAFHFTYANATDFDGVRGQEYPLTYDNAGALVSDAGRGIARTDYDLCGNPVRIQFTDGSVTRYIYSAAGEKLRVTYLTAVPNITVPIGGTRELSPSEILSADSTDYLLGGTLTMRNGRIDKYLFDEGYCQAVKVPFNPGQDSFTFYYYDRDHLGSVRQVIEAEGTDQGTVVQKMSYYPSGLQLCDNTTDSDVQPNRYNGKELDKMHGLNTYDYGARQYNPVTARWDRVDPLCEKYYSISPYAYCGNNPVKYIDPDGRDDYYDKQGNYIKHEDNETDNIMIHTSSIIFEFQNDKLEVPGYKPLKDNLLTAEAYSGLFTDVLSKNGVDLNQLVGNKVNVGITRNLDVLDYYGDVNLELGVTASLDSKNHTSDVFNLSVNIDMNQDNRYMLSTISNIVNSLVIHEFQGHGINKLSSDPASHLMIYEMQKNHPSWNRTTNDYKEQIELQIKAIKNQ